jgi:hypothetical protein
MRKSIKNLAIANNETINDSAKVKGGANAGVTSVNFVITDNVIGLTQGGGGIGENIQGVVIEDNVMV